MTSTAWQRALDHRASVVVSANAGSGKTTVLVNRLLRLLMEGARPDRILCLTYTRSAAAEMGNRLTGSLSKWSTASEPELREILTHLLGHSPDGKEIQHAASLLVRVLDTPGGLRIRTIHAFCSSLIARFPVEAGVPLHGMVLDEAAQGEMEGEVWNSLLTLAGSAPQKPLGSAFVRLLRESTPAGVRDLVTGFLRLPGAGRAGEGERLATRLGQALGGVTEGVASLAAAGPVLRWLGGEQEGGTALAAIARGLEQGTDSDRQAARFLGTFLAASPDGPDGRTAMWEDFRSLFLTRQGKPRKRLASRAALRAMPDLDSRMTALVTALLGHEQRLRAARHFDFTMDVATIALAFDRACRQVREQHGCLTFDDLVNMALLLLEKPGIAPWIQFKTDGGLDHVLVDESQDVSGVQWRIISYLVEGFFAVPNSRQQPQTLFTVGDGKQSIYSFQGAAPRLFAEETARHEALAGHTGLPFFRIPLTRSWRSAPAILELVDAVLALPRVREAVSTGPPCPGHESTRSDAPGNVVLWPLAGKEAAADGEVAAFPRSYARRDSPGFSLARQVAARIREWVHDREAPVDPGTIMVLGQRRGAEMALLARELGRAGIPVAGVDRMNLLAETAINDLLGAIEFVLLPENDLALAVVLRSPLAGFTEEELEAAACGRGKLSLWESLRKRAGTCPACARAVRLLSGWLARADFMPPFEFLSALLDCDGGREAMVRRMGTAVHEPLDELLVRALAWGKGAVSSLQEFSAWLQAQSRIMIKRDMEKESGAIRIMSVHGAKGLEASVVILLDAGRGPDSGKDERLPFLLEEGIPVCVRGGKQNDVPATARARQRLRQDRYDEYLRLLYVAMTRARDSLHIAGIDTDDTNDGREAEENGEGDCERSWWALVNQAMRAPPFRLLPDGDGFLCHGTGTVRPPAGSGTPPLERVPQVAEDAPGSGPAWLWTSPAPETRKDLPEAPSPRELLVAGAGSHALLRGQAVHSLLQFLPDVAPDLREETARRYLGNAGRQLPLATRREIVTRVLALFRMPGAEMLFGPGSRAEAGIAGEIGGRMFSGRVDRLVVTENRILVADYKDTHTPPADPASTDPAYLRQMALYAALLRNIYPGREVDAAIIWTGGPVWMELPGSLLAGFVPEAGGTERQARGDAALVAPREDPS